MNGSTDNRASGSSEASGRPETVLNLAIAERMLPLVRKIVDDVLQSNQRLAQLVPEQNRLERLRRTLAWPERCRRYELSEEIAAQERRLQEALAELEILGLALLDADRGRVGFPTLVNQRRAYFAWCPGEDRLRHWQFAGESTIRPIPVNWVKEAEKETSRP